MYNPTFGRSTLDRHILKSDFRTYPSLADDAIRAASLEAAGKLGQQGFSNVKLRTNNLAGRIIYQLVDLPSQLVLRKAAENLRKISFGKQSNRSEIIRRLQSLLQEGMPFCVAKFDISNFYESVHQQRLIDLVERRFITAPSTRLVLTSFLQQCSSKGISGVPRGLAISAALSELYMQDFDQRMRFDLANHFFARYVDDVIVITKPTINSKQLRQDVARRLPFGLKLNKSKTRVLTFDAQPTPPKTLEDSLDYLGYSFDIYRIDSSKRPRRRTVTLDIAQSKVKRRKTRIVLAVRKYLNDHNFDDLHDRFKLITCNFRFFDHRKARRRRVGLCYDYELIAIPSSALKELDEFMRKILLCNNGKVGAALAQTLSQAQRDELLRLSFARGFKGKTHFHFSAKRLKHLIACWKYA